MDLKKYLRNVVELEKAIYTINKSIGYLERSKRNLGISQSYEEPVLPKTLSKGVTLILTFAVTLSALFQIGYVLWAFGVLGTLNSYIVYFLVGILGALVAKRILVDKKTVAQVNEYKEQKEKYDILVEQDALRVKKEVQKKRNIDTQIVA